MARGRNLLNVCSVCPMKTILAELSRLIDNLYDNMSYVLIGGLEGQIQ